MKWTEEGGARRRRSRWLAIASYASLTTFLTVFLLLGMFGHSGYVKKKKPRFGASQVPSLYATPLTLLDPPTLSRLPRLRQDTNVHSRSVGPGCQSQSVHVVVTCNVGLIQCREYPQPCNIHRRRPWHERVSSVSSMLCHHCLGS